MFAQLSLVIYSDLWERVDKYQTLVEGFHNNEWYLPPYEAGVNLRARFGHITSLNWGEKSIRIGERSSARNDPTEEFKPIMTWLLGIAIMVSVVLVLTWALRILTHG